MPVGEKLLAGRHRCGLDIVATIAERPRECCEHRCLPDHPVGEHDARAIRSCISQDRCNRARERTAMSEARERASVAPDLRQDIRLRIDRKGRDGGSPSDPRAPCQEHLDCGAGSERDCKSEIDEHRGSHRESRRNCERKPLELESPKCGQLGCRLIDRCSSHGLPLEPRVGPGCGDLAKDLRGGREDMRFIRSTELLRADFASRAEDDAERRQER